jgi:hypothetical protein
LTENRISLEEVALVLALTVAVASVTGMLTSDDWLTRLLHSRQETSMPQFKHDLSAHLPDDKPDIWRRAEESHAGQESTPFSTL